ncbi:MAG: GNAT family N-acetyltransferase [Bacteroides sp.]|nr:GNAT family N-acetyltransferase [Roseburia sp.]MCM1346837.1 GNAT family N-acetyltransferase [Bacteroides sp.]MCM1420637.1 GNAT family N-acetyltransferase [Bacteroides sp.]
MTEQAHFAFAEYSRIADLEQQWEQLDRIGESQDMPYVSYSFYQTYIWHKFLYDYIHNNPLRQLTVKFSYVLMTYDGLPFAIIPLYITRSSGKMRFPSCRVAGILNATAPFPMKGNEGKYAALQRYIEENYKAKKLSWADVPQCSPFAEVMRNLGGNYTERASYHVPLSEYATIDEYIGSLSKNIYKNIRKAYNHQKTDGKNVELKVYTYDTLPGNKYLYQLWRIYFIRKLAWNGRQVGTLGKVKASVKAITEIMTGCATKSLRRLKESRLYVLEIDSVPAAFMIVYAHRKHLLMPRLAIDTTYSRYSPGIVLLLESAKLWLDEGIVDFDMCRGDERYKTDMGGVNEPLCRIERGKII